MSLEPVLLKDKKENKKAVKWCVYFDEESGDIITVTNKPKERIRHPYLQTSDIDAKSILMGVQDPKKFAVVQLTEGYKLIQRGDVIRIRESENFLTSIPMTNNNSDVNVVFYINSWKMEVNFSQETLYKMTGKRQFRDVSINPEKDGKYDKIVLYLIKENDPNFLIDTIEIDPADLIVKGFVMFDLSKLRNVCAVGEINVLTKKIFKNYGIKRKSHFVNADFTSKSDKRRNQVVVSKKHEAVDTTFTIIKRDEHYWLKSNFLNPHEHRLFTNLKLYVIKKNNPNHLMEPIYIPFSDVGNYNEFYLTTNSNLEECNFLALSDNRNITFDIIEEDLLNV